MVGSFYFSCSKRSPSQIITIHNNILDSGLSKVNLNLDFNILPQSKEYQMRKTSFFVFLIVSLFTTSLFSQWSQTNGIKGGYFASVVSTGTGLIANTGNGNIFNYDGSTWSAGTAAVTATSLHNAGNGALVAINYGKIFVSIDNGTSWNERLIPEAVNADPVVKDGKIFVLSSSGDSLYQSLDLGVTWNGLQLGTTFQHNGETKNIFMVNHFDVAGDRLFVNAFTDMSPVSFILLESPDLGQTWFVSFLPQQSEMIQLIGAKDDLAILCTTDGVYKKSSGGTWTSASAGLPHPVSTNLNFRNLKPINNQFYSIVSGDFSGLFKFNGESWENLNATGFVTDFDLHDGTLIATTTNKVIKLSNNSWNSISDDLIASTAIPIPMNKDVVFSRYAYSLYRTTNGGANWDSVSVSTGNLTFRNNEIFSWNQSGMILSTDLGSSWSQISSSGIPSDYISKVSGIAVSGNTIYSIFHGTRRRDHLPAVWEQGGVYRSTNNGSTWQSLNSGITHEGGVPAPGTEIYASGSTVLFKSIEGVYTLNNSSWQKVSNTIPAPVYFTSFDIVSDSIFIGSSQGLLLSTNNGASWLPINHGLQPTNFQFFYINFFRFMGKYYAYDGDINVMYKLTDTTWSPVPFNPPAELQTISFAQAGNQLYIGTIDRGIWKYIDNPTDVQEDQNLPTAFNLDQNYPNPFNPSTTIRFSLLKDGFTTLRIYNILGELKAELLNNEMTAGNHSINFDASSFSSGIYLYTLTSNGNSVTKKMTLLK